MKLTILTPNPDPESLCDQPGCDREAGVLAYRLVVSETLGNRQRLYACSYKHLAALMRRALGE